MQVLERCNARHPFSLWDVIRYSESLFCFAAPGVELIVLGDVSKGVRVRPADAFAPLGISTFCLIGASSSHTPSSPDLKIDRQYREVGPVAMDMPEILCVTLKSRR
jgi:hypothetical protein